MTTSKFTLTPVVALALSMTGCEFIGPQFHQKLPLADVKPASGDQLSLPELSNEADKNAENKVTKVELFPNGEPVINAQANTTSEPKKSVGKGEYSLNFDDADLGEVAKVILGDILNRNYTISPQVTGKVTLQTSKPLSKEELIPTLEMLLSLNNAALSTLDGVYLIKPSNEAIYSSSINSLSGSKMPNGYQVRIIPVKNVAAAELGEILKPLLPEKALLHVDANRNLLMVAGSGAELGRVMDVVNTFDTDILKGRSFALFTPAHVSAGKVIDELDQIFNHKQEKDKAGDSSFFRFIEIERLNAILAITHQAHYLKDIENWILRLDRINPAAAGGVNVYRAQHVSASDLAETLSGIFGNGSGQRSSKASIASGRKSMSASNRSSSSSSGTGASSSTTGTGTSSSSSSRSGGDSERTLSDRNQDRNRSSGASGSVGSVLGNASTAGSSNNDMPNVKIIPDDGNNALIIVANSEEYSKILRVIKQLDVLPLQVMIDATIVEVTLKDDLQYGIQWYLQHENGGTNIASGGADNGLISSGTLTDIAKGIGTGGFSYAFSSGSKDINAVLKAGATNNNINVISSPSLMVLNNQEASIKVGDSVPILTSTTTFTTGTATSNNIQMVDTGVNLAVRPRVNSGGLVLMDILQSVNQAIPTTGTGGTGTSTINSPTIQKREIETSVVVQSGETIVLGGLIKENNDYSRFGVPLLHEIPLVGPLFGSTTRNKDKTELVVLLTPRVMKSRIDAQDVTHEFRRKLSGIYREPDTINIEIEEETQ